ncbi:hypothetical protein MIND_00173700 [Mycena indigotica]|uniref:Uncharacterized protein n=1 Tax=Mycena indigotica TaxID=2126181 RepID=A0A8H6WF97_9AGAR|nr:uncharacterized protein MIND_00173700 [Mycena indigotica]KAF7316544.1 hypothetical protein MIND_00173700 [Mycena indigotica]
MSSTPSQIPVPKKSLRSRMGGVIRRTSSALSLPKSKSGSTDDSSSNTRRSSVGTISKNADAKRSSSSLIRRGSEAKESQPQDVINIEPTTIPQAEPAEVASANNSVPISPTTMVEPIVVLPPANGDIHDPTKSSPVVKRLLPVLAHYQMHPSPISESPIREAAANAEEAAESNPQVQPSPLANVVAADAPAMEDEPTPAVSAPLVFDDADMGVLTDEPQDMHVEEVIVIPVVEQPGAESAPDPSYFELVPPPAADTVALESTVIVAVPIPDDTVEPTQESHSPLPSHTFVEPTQDSHSPLPDHTFVELTEESQPPLPDVPVAESVLNADSKPSDELKDKETVPPPATQSTSSAVHTAPESVANGKMPANATTSNAPPPSVAEEVQPGGWWETWAASIYNWLWLLWSNAGSTSRCEPPKST